MHLQALAFVRRLWYCLTLTLIYVDFHSTKRFENIVYDIYLYYRGLDSSSTLHRFVPYKVTDSHSSKICGKVGFGVKKDLAVKKL